MAVRLLIVDDHAGFRAAARRLLEADGCAIVGEAADGEAALDAARALAPDVVVLDVQLPGADGFAVARALATLDPAPRVLLVSSRDRADYGELVDASGAAGFVPKADLTGAAVRAVLT